MRTFASSLDNYEQDRNNQKNEEHRKHQTGSKYAGQRTPQTGMGQNHGSHAHCRCHRRQENRAQPALARFERGFFQRDARSTPFVDVVNQND